jgi:hypothetical protein
MFASLLTVLLLLSPSLPSMHATDPLPATTKWTVTALPPSIRLDPTTSDIIIVDMRQKYRVREASGADLTFRGSLSVCHTRANS